MMQADVSFMEKVMKRDTIAIRDPFVLAVPEEETYYLYGTTDPDPWKQSGIVFDAYMSADLEDWRGPYPVFHPMTGFWGTHNFWAPEVYRYRNAFYMFASFKAPRHERATQILRADTPLGPFEVHSAGPVTPSGWECLDGTFFVEDGQPWLIFSHEWVQVNDGEMWAVPLSPDLRRTEGAPSLLFRGLRWSLDKRSGAAGRQRPRRCARDRWPLRVSGGPRQSISFVVEHFTFGVCPRGGSFRIWPDQRPMEAGARTSPGSRSGAWHDFSRI